MINKKLRWLITLIILALLLGCGAKVMVTESGVEIPKPLRYSYFFLEYSNDISDLVGRLTAELYFEEIISEEDKDIIGLYWADHKKAHNILQNEVKKWYNEVDSGYDVSNKKQIAVLMYNVIEETETLQKILDEVSGGKVTIPEGLIVNLYGLYDVIRSQFNG